MHDKPSAATDDQTLRVPDVEHDRYASFGFLPWWRQDKVRSATILVVGAGALGNEVIKNLALLGIGHLLIVDHDVVEMANLTRSILFREADRGRPKAEVAAAAVKRINPDVEAKAIVGDVTLCLGLGVFRRVDVVVGCLDNREARLFVNRACFRVGKPWIDGGIHEMLGELRWFWPGRGACYECTLSAADYRAMNARYACSALPKEVGSSGYIATTPTIASIIGGIEAQEAMKLIHGLEVDAGSTMVWNGLLNEVYSVRRDARSQCSSHGAYGDIRENEDLCAETTTVQQMLELAREALGAEAALVLDFELLVSFNCPDCQVERLVVSRSHDAGHLVRHCEHCGSDCWPHLTHVISGGEPFLTRTLSDIGVPNFHILVARSGSNQICFELTGDHSNVFTLSEM